MLRQTSILVALLSLAVTAMAAGPAVEKVQGLYEGERTAAGASQKFEARVVALGKGNYKVHIREAADGNAVKKAELDGVTDGEAVKFTGKSEAGDWSGVYADGKITGTVGADGKVEMKRVVRESPTMGAKCPEGGIVLLDGKNFDQLETKATREGKEEKWQVADDGGVLRAKGGIYTKQAFGGSFKMHVEFKNPLMPDARGQGRGNSGCFMPNGDEVQVLDSFGMETYKGGGCGGIYKYKDPEVFDKFALASSPPGQWQTYDIEYVVEMKDGKPTGKPELTVMHNGIKVQDKFKLHRDGRMGKLQWQDHKDPVQYRNIWIVPAK